MRQKEVKRDFVAPTQKMKMDETGKLGIKEIGNFDLNNHANRQIANHLKIPFKYYEMMKQEAPQLLSQNVNHWFKEKPSNRMVRTLDGNARAFLSNSYRPIDNDQVAEMALPIINEMDCNIVSSDITESKLYLKCLFPRLEAEVKVGDPVQCGLVISNSEIGLGSVSVQMLIYRLVCKNGAIFADGGLRKYHVGRSTVTNDAIEFYKDDTRLADDRAFLLKFRDTVSAIVDETKFQERVIKLRQVAEGEKVENPVKAVEVLQDKFTLSKSEGNSVLKHLIEGGDLTQWGVANAITRTSQDLEDYDRATDFETLGGEIIELPKSSWESIRAVA